LDASGTPVGMTTYMNIDEDNLRLEIGSTWYRGSVQRTAINTECKLMLLSHAFEKLNCIAVEFRTHWFNQQSRRGIERLGAKLDGVCVAIKSIVIQTLKIAYETLVSIAFWLTNFLPHKLICFIDYQCLVIKKR
jgi:hypothetical protein